MQPGSVPEHRWAEGILQALLATIQKWELSLSRDTGQQKWIAIPFQFPESISALPGEGKIQQFQYCTLPEGLDRRGGVLWNARAFRDYGNLCLFLWSFGWEPGTS